MVLPVDTSLADTPPQPFWHMGRLPFVERGGGAPSSRASGALSVQHHPASFCGEARVAAATERTLCQAERARLMGLGAVIVATFGRVSGQRPSFPLALV